MSDFDSSRLVRLVTKLGCRLVYGAQYSCDLAVRSLDGQRSMPVIRGELVISWTTAADFEPGMPWRLSLTTSSSLPGACPVLFDLVSTQALCESRPC